MHQYAISELPLVSFLEWLLVLTFYMIISFHSHANEIHFHMSGWAPSLVLKRRTKVIWKWPLQIILYYCWFWRRQIEINSVLVNYHEKKKNEERVKRKATLFWNGLCADLKAFPWACLWLGARIKYVCHFFPGLFYFSLISCSLWFSVFLAENKVAQWNQSFAYQFYKR